MIYRIPVEEKFAQVQQRYDIFNNNNGSKGDPWGDSPLRVEILENCNFQRYSRFVGNI